MKVLKRTPKTELIQRMIGTKALDIIPSVAEKLEFPERDVEYELMGLVILSARVGFDDGELDFSPVTVSDTADQIADKFIRYLNSERIDTLDKAKAQLYETDRPDDPALTPAKPEAKDNDPKSKS